MSNYEDRHPSTQHMMKMLEPNPNLRSDLKDVSEDIFVLAVDIVSFSPDSPELTAGLRKLLEAKDCFVRGLVDPEPSDYRDR